VEETAKQKTIWEEAQGALEAHMRGAAQFGMGLKEEKMTPACLRRDAEVTKKEVMEHSSSEKEKTVQKGWGVWSTIIN
jgi:hypothetical protein